MGVGYEMKPAKALRKEYVEMQVANFTDQQRTVFDYFVRLLNECPMTGSTCIVGKISGADAAFVTRLCNVFIFNGYVIETVQDGEAVKIRISLLGHIGPL